MNKDNIRDFLIKAYSRCPNCGGLLIRKQENDSDVMYKCRKCQKEYYIDNEHYGRVFVMNVAILYIVGHITDFICKGKGFLINILVFTVLVQIPVMIKGFYFHKRLINK